MSFVIQDFSLSFRSLTDILLNEKCSAMIELTVVMKNSKSFQHHHLLPEELRPSLY